MYIENVKIKSEEIGLSALQSLLHGKSVRLLSNNCSGEINAQSHYFLGNWSTWSCTDIGKTQFWFILNKICMSQAVPWNVVLLHLLQKCPHKFADKMKKVSPTKSYQQWSWHQWSEMLLTCLSPQCCKYTADSPLYVEQMTNTQYFEL